MNMDIFNKVLTYQPNATFPDASKQKPSVAKNLVTHFKHFAVQFQSKKPVELITYRHIEEYEANAELQITQYKKTDILSAKSLSDLVNLHTGAAIEVADVLANSAVITPFNANDLIDAAKKELQVVSQVFHSRYIEEVGGVFKGNYPQQVTPKMLKAAKKAREDMAIILTTLQMKLDGIKSNKMDQSLQHSTEKLLQFSIAKQLNTKRTPWCQIEKDIYWKGQCYVSRMVPARTMPSLKHRYKASGLFGVSSMTTNEERHAVNLWKSEFQNTAGSVRFTGIRHGVNTPFAIKEASERKQGADNRTREVILAAADACIEAISKHCRKNKGQPFELRITSTSLLTPAQFYGRKAYKERAFVQEQLEAWKRFDGKILDYTFRDTNGKTQRISIKPKIVSFNFGVNGGAKMESKPGLDKLVKLLDKSDKIDITGWKFANQHNDDNMVKLLNWAVNAANTCKDFAKKSRIETYIRNILELRTSNQHRKDGHRAYALPNQIVLLSNEIGVIPAWNCMSGKDRAGLLDAEIKQALIEQDQHSSEAVADFSKAMTDRRQQLHDIVLLNSGNHEIQQANTGVKGYKIFEGGKLMVKSNATNIADSNRPAVRGLSAGVEA